jgi:hypothetical protein
VGGENMAQNTGNTGMYQLACEASPHKDQIDAWLNEKKPFTWISNQLKEMNDYISTNSISKYKEYRDEKIKHELQETPEFQAKQQMVQSEFNNAVSKIQVVDLVGNLGTLINDSAELLEQAKTDKIQINNVKDLRMVQQTMIDAIKVYGETMLNAQKFEAINKNPDLLANKSTTINFNVKTALSEILKGAVVDGGDGFSFIDKLRAGIGQSH